LETCFFCGKNRCLNFGDIFILDCYNWYKIRKVRLITEAMQKEYYWALVDKKAEYEGTFFVGVKTTGIFCRPTCPARKPKFEHCEFFEIAQDALLASFRPCRRCKPLSHPGQVSKLVQFLVEAVEKNPEKRWKNRDFKELSVDASTARRQFKKRFGMTFVEYARARRMGIAMKQIREGEAVIEAQMTTGYESSSGFRDAFSRIMGAAPTKLGDEKIFKASWLDSPLGPMIAIADEKDLYLLEFVERRGLEREVERLRKRMRSAIIPGRTDPIISIEKELAEYFNGQLKEFKTPLFLLGTPFQQTVWEELKKIPYGQTCSYAELAAGIKKKSAFRAVAQANGANQLAIVIPCHRVINSNGELGGYGGGVPRKKWLIHHESKEI
jgi:AraC family transcriptional regulator of adaptative response/methylated-DNA-[protein]-cysteine methyltransferase